MVGNVVNKVLENIIDVLANTDTICVSGNTSISANQQVSLNLNENDIIVCIAQRDVKTKIFSSNTTNFQYIVNTTVTGASSSIGYFGVVKAKTTGTFTIKNTSGYVAYYCIYRFDIV